VLYEEQGQEQEQDQLAFSHLFAVFLSQLDLTGVVTTTWSMLTVSFNLFQ
jgi:hypothetical protein